MVKLEDTKISVEGPITVDNVASMTRRGITFFDGKPLVVVDLKNVAEVDSSIICMFLEWLREAKQRKVHIDFINIPISVKSLMQLYGVSEFLCTISNDQSDS